MEEGEEEEEKRGRREERGRENRGKEGEREEKKEGEGRREEYCRVTCYAILLAVVGHQLSRPLIFHEFHSGTIGLNISNQSFN